MDYTAGARYIVPLRITVLHSIENRYKSQVGPSFHALKQLKQLPSE
ncbi:MAG TPA: hypothetical protein V6C90_00540 [Coleofasciculaceae cyanobacterium]